MLYTYIDLKKKGYTNYRIKQLVDEKKLYKIEKGLYSDQKENSDLEIVVKLYSDAIITLESAFYYYGLLKKEPSYIHLATYQNARKIENKRVKQLFMTTRLLNIGIVKMNYKGISMNTYNLERLLIELVRNKTSIKYETYNEIITNYRRISKLLSKPKLAEYLMYFKDKRILERIQNEVFKKSTI